ADAAIIYRTADIAHGFPHSILNCGTVAWRERSCHALAPACRLSRQPLRHVHGRVRFFFAHDSGELKAIFDQGLAAYDRGRYAEAFPAFRSTDEEDVAAMRNEGLMLRKGLGTEKDPKAAEEML